MPIKRKRTKSGKENVVKQPIKKICLQDEPRILRKRPALQALETNRKSKLRRIPQQRLPSPATSNDSYHSAKTSLSSADEEFPQLPVFDEYQQDSGDFFDVEECGEFQRLPDHVLTKIMGYLPRKSKLALTKTCKRFERIFNEPENMKTFLLVLDLDTNDIPQLKRRYRQIQCKNLVLPATQGRLEQITNLFKTSGDSLTHLEFTNCTLSSDFLLKVLKFCQNINYLSIVRCKIIKDATDSLHYTMIPQLKTFHIDVNAIPVAAAVLRKVNSLENFILKPDNADHPFLKDLVYKSLKNNLKNQHNLKKLEICDPCFFKNEFSGVKFQVSDLVLCFSHFHRDQPTHMAQFLLQQTEITKLIINVRFAFGTDDFNTAMDHVLALPSLRDLSIVFYTDSLVDLSFMDSSVVNPRIQNLFVSFRAAPHNYWRLVEKTTKIFPGVTNLHIKVDKEWVESANTTIFTFRPLNSLKNLEKLHFEGGSTRFLPMLRLPNLKVLQLLHLREAGDGDITEFLLENRQVEEIFAAFPGPGLGANSQVILWEIIWSYFEQSILWLQNCTSIKACVKNCLNIEIPKDALNGLRGFAVASKGPKLRLLQLCGNKMEF